MFVAYLVAFLAASFSALVAFTLIKTIGQGGDH